MTDPHTLVGEMEALLAKATPGPWRRRHSGSPYIDIVSENAGDEAPLVTLHEAGAHGELASRHAETLANAALIVAAVNALPQLLAMLKAQREALEPFAREAKRLGLTEDRDRYSFANTGLSNADLRNARAALEGKQPSPKQGEGA